jgi:hypothetical protein
VTQSSIIRDKQIMYYDKVHITLIKIERVLSSDKNSRCNSICEASCDLSHGDMVIRRL